MNKTETKIRDLWATRVQVAQDIAEKKQILDAIDDQLKNAIPKNEVVAGVRHVYSESRSISYASAIKRAREKLSKVALGHLENAIEESTKTKVTERIMEAKTNE